MPRPKKRDTAETICHLDSLGRVLIPIAMRRKLGLTHPQEMTAALEGDAVVFRRWMPGKDAKKLADLILDQARQQYIETEPEYVRELEIAVNDLKETLEKEPTRP